MPDPTPTPNPSPSPPATGGDTPAPWFADDQKDYVTNKGWKAPADAVTSAINLEKLMGADKAGRTVVMPKDDKDVEGLKAFRAKMGVPESADKYELPFPDGESGDFAKTAASWFHKQGVPKAAAQEIAKEWNTFFEGMLKEDSTKLQAESQKQLDTLKTEWGNDFDKNSEFARRFLRASGWDDAKVKKYEDTFGTAAMLKDFHGWGSKTGEHDFAGGGGGGSFSLSPQAAKEKLGDLRQQRIEGKITQKDYLEQMEKLAPLAEKAA